MKAKAVAISVLVLLAAHLSAATLSAQTQNAEISGRVLDPDALPLPGATVSVKVPETGYSRLTITGETGRYVIGNLPPGMYVLQVEIPGFQTIVREGVLVTAGAEIELDVPLNLAGVEEVVTVTGETPIIEVTANKIGGTLSRREIEDTPSNFRNFTALTQLVPGMTPNPAASTFEGGQVNANGNPSASNVYMIDGGYNNDDRLGGSQGTQVRVVLDVVEEYQVLSNQYAAEFGGGGGAIINMVTKGGTNSVRGRVYGFFRDEALYARSSFLPDDQDKPDQRTVQAGFGVGGPIVKDRAHFYLNYERDEEETGSFKSFPAAGAPIAYDHIGYFTVDANNLFARVDFQGNTNNHFMWRFSRETAPAIGEGFNTGIQMFDAIAYEQDLDESHMFSWTSVVGDRASNVARFSWVHEDLRGTAPKAFYDDDIQWIGQEGLDQFDLGASNIHPSYIAGPGGVGNRTIIYSLTFDDAYSYFIPTGRGEHSLKLGGGYSSNSADPRSTVDSGTFTFNGDLPYNPANPATYPTQYDILLGAPGSDFNVVTNDWRAYFFVQDKWRVNENLTLNLGLRYDAQNIVPESRDDFSPRIGVAFDPTGDGKTVIRGGVGKFYEYTRVAVDLNLQQNGVLTLFPSASISNAASPVLRPDVTTDSDGNLGVAVLSAAGQAELEALRAAVLAGTTFNRNPQVDSADRQMGYQWSWNVGVTRELVPDLAVSVDYVGNASRDQLGFIDINDPVNGVRPGVNVFDPNGEIVPPEARGVNFARVLQYQTGSQFDGDYKSLQFSLVKRFSNRFSTRNAYTIQRSNYVGTSNTGAAANPEVRRVWLDNDPRADYGRFAFNQTHVLSMSGTFEVWRGLSLAGIMSYSSGRPVNELTGADDNADADRNDRPIDGVNNVRPIESETDDLGRAAIFGVDGPNFVEVNVSARYNFNFAEDLGITLFWDAYNLGNRTNYNTPTGNQRSGTFLVPTSALLPRQMQLGIRFQF